MLVMQCVSIITKVGGCERHHLVEVVAEVPDHAAHDGGAADLELDVGNSSGAGGCVDSSHSDLPIHTQLEHILDMSSVIKIDGTQNSIVIKPY